MRVEVTGGRQGTQSSKQGHWCLDRGIQTEMK